MGTINLAPCTITARSREFRLIVRLLADGSEHAGLVVVGSRGRGEFAGLLLGSVSQEVLQRARCPVVVVHRRA